MSAQTVMAADTSAAAETPSASERDVAPENGVVVEALSKTFGEGEQATHVLHDIDVVIPRGRFVSLIGPSGCGKSTLLRILAGLETPDRGAASLFGATPVAACQKKMVGLVPQSPTLLPWRTVRQNVTLPFEVNRRARPKEEIARWALDPEEVLAEVGLADAMDKKPNQLSGGMQQRVAIARAFCFGAPLLLMDEPFSALDEFTRETLRFQLLHLWEHHQKTVVFVTHSVSEAVTLSDTVLVMGANPGRVHAVIDVDLPRPRSVEVEDSEAFSELTARVKATLREGLSR